MGNNNPTSLGGIIPKGVPALIANSGGVDKKINMLDMGVKICKILSGKHSSAGANWGGQNSVVIVTAQYSKNKVHQHLNTLLNEDEKKNMAQNLIIVPTCDVGGPSTLVTVKDGAVVTTPDYENFLTQLKLINNHKLVIFDPLWLFAGGYLSHNPALSQGLWQAFYRICSEGGATVLAALCDRKDDIISFEQARADVRGYYELVDVKELEEVINDCVQGVVYGGGMSNVREF